MAKQKVNLINNENGTTCDAVHVYTRSKIGNLQKNRKLNNKFVTTTAKRWLIFIMTLYPIV